MHDEYGSQHSEDRYSVEGQAEHEPQAVAQTSETELLINDALTFCEALCEEFRRRWNRNERFYRSKQWQATRLFILEELAVASDGERTVSRRYPEHLYLALKAIAELTKQGTALHKLDPDGAVVVGKSPDQQCVRINDAIVEILSKLNPVRTTAPGATVPEAVY